MVLFTAHFIRLLVECISCGMSLTTALAVKKVLLGLPSLHPGSSAASRSLCVSFLPAPLSLKGLKEGEGFWQTFWRTEYSQSQEERLDDCMLLQHACVDCKLRSHNGAQIF